MDRFVAVDPERAGADIRSDAMRATNIGGPYSAREAKDATICDLNGFGFVIERDQRNDGAENLFICSGRVSFEV